VFVYASLREQAQHRWIHTPCDYHHTDKAKHHYLVYHIEKRTFFDFGWLGKKQALEIAQWVGGSAVVSIPWYYFG
jgi:hypothetical protein